MIQRMVRVEVVLDPEIVEEADLDGRFATYRQLLGVSADNRSD